MPSTAVDQIPIVVQEESEFIHYPAGPEDIRSVLRALPKGVTDGLTSIELCLGKKDQIRPTERWAAPPTPDPYVGREGLEILPGIFSGNVLGTYYPSQAMIRINADVGAKDALSRVHVRFYLRMYMLMTLVHEIAHHYDFSARVARGRWLADDRDKVEIYAEQVQHDWFSDYVVPCLKKDYPDQWDAFHKWTRDKIGVPLPVEVLLGDPRTTAKGNRIIIQAMFDTGEAFRDFVSVLQTGRDVNRARLEFARDLHYAEHYESALRIIDLLLESDRDDINVSVLKADIFNHMDRYEEALNISRQVLQKESSWADALATQADALMGLERYRQAIAAIDKLLVIVEKTPREAASWQEEKAKALIELGHYAEAEGILVALEKLADGYSFWKRRIERLRKKCRRRHRQE